MANDREFLDNISQIDAALSSSDAQLTGQDIGQICEVINRVRKPLESVLPIIEMIPVYGKTIARALKLLLQLSTTVCSK